MSGYKMRLVTLLVAGLMAGCTVTNPGPVQDEFLNESPTHAGLVNGAAREILIGSMKIFYVTAIITREIFPGGDTNSFSPRVQAGALPSAETDQFWNPIQQARFIAEDALRRFDEPGVTVDPKVKAQALLWAGYANKILGENFCQVVFDGGPAMPPTAALDKAEGFFTDAIAAAADNEQLQAAYAGRAQVRIEKGDWPGAVSDAAQVSLDFQYGIDADPAEVDTRNFIAWANFNQNYRQYTYHFTYYYDYYPATGDPRVRWTTDPDFPVANASLPGFGNVPWSFDPDFPLNSPVVLATGTEMMLYRAEELLINGQWQQAMALINQVHTHFNSDFTGEPLAPLTANSAEEAGTVLKNERLVDEHLRGRRFMDLRRWNNRDATPGTYYWPNWGELTPIFDEEPTATCIPIPDSEREINHNLTPP